MKAILTLVLSLLALGATAQTIDNPRYDYRLSSEMNITRIERNRKATRLHIHAIKTAGRTFTVDSLWTINSTHDTTLVLAPLRTEGVTLGKCFEMPDNGTHDFVIVYPPLPRNTACIDFAPTTSNATIGLKLNADNATPASTVSMERDEWLAAHPDIVDESTGEDYDLATFFRQDTAWVRGQVGHYHAGTPLSVYPGFYLHMGGWRFRETKVNDDGTFLIPLYLDHPTTFSLRFFPKANLWAQASVMYIEPGDTLDVFVDWEEDLLDAWRDRTIFPLTIRGRLAEVNRQITAIPTPTFSYFGNGGNTMEERLHNMMQELFPWRERMNGYIQRADLYPKVRHYARAMKEVEFGTRLWDMVWITTYDSLSSVRRPLAPDDVEQFIVNHYGLDGWFSSLKSMPLDDPAVLATVSGYLLQENLGIDCMLHRYFMDGAKPKDRPEFNRETCDWEPYSPDSLATALERRTRWIGQGDAMRIGAQAIAPRDTMSLLEQVAVLNSMARYIFNSDMSGSHGTTNGTNVIRWHDFLRQNVAMARRFVTVPALRRRLERIAEYMSEERPDVGNSGIMLWF